MTPAQEEAREELIEAVLACEALTESASASKVQATVARRDAADANCKQLGFTWQQIAMIKKRKWNYRPNL